MIMFKTSWCNKICPWILFVVVSAALTGANFYWLRLQYDERFTSIVQRNRNVAQLLGGHMESTLNFADIFLQKVAKGRSDGLVPMKEDEFIILPSGNGVRSLFFVSSSGEVKNLTDDERNLPSGNEIAALGLECKDPEKTIVTRTLYLPNGTLALLMFRIVQDGRGHCRGFVGAAIDMEYFGQLYEKLLMDSEASVVVVSSDTVIYRYPLRPDAIGKKFSTPEVQRSFESAQTKGAPYLIYKSIIDQKERLFVFYPMRSAPFVLAVGVPKSMLWSGWWKESWLSFIPLLVLLAALGIMVSEVRKLLRKISALGRTMESTQTRLAKANQIEKLGGDAVAIGTEFQNIVAMMSAGAASLEKIFKGHDEVARLSRNLGRGKNLVEHFQAVSRGVEQVFDLSGLLAEMEGNFRINAVKTKIQFELSAPEEVLVFGDPLAMHQVLMNVFSNAVDALEERGGILRAEVNVDRSKGLASIRISDNGPGIKAQDLNKVFEPYYTTKVGGRGTGLGLSIARDLVRSMSGSISIDSALGKGTIATITLPVLKKKVGDADFLKVVVVDDDAEIAAFLESEIRSLGHLVTVYTDPGAAVMAARTGRVQWDLALVDFQMPDMDGVAVVSELNRFNPRGRLVLMSGYPEKARSAARKRQVILESPLLEKPVTRADLADLFRGMST